MSCSSKDTQELVVAGTSSGTTPCLKSKLCVFETCRCQPNDEESPTVNNDSDADDTGASGTVVPCVVSSSSSCCRICQDTSDTTEVLSRCQCHCKGQLSRVHRSCLAEWVRYKGSNRCEICGGIFRDIPSPALGFGVNQIDALEELRQQLVNYHPISRRKRTTIAGVLLFLLVVTGVTGVLTVGADREFQKVTEDPFASDHELKKAHIVFSMCMAFLFFCITLTIGMGLLWFVLELYFYMHRRRILNQATTRMLSEARRRTSMWRTSVV